MTKKEYKERLRRIEEKALETHSIGAAAMALEQIESQSVEVRLNEISNRMRSELAFDMVNLEEERLASDRIEVTNFAQGNAYVPTFDWTTLPNKIQKCIWLAHDIVAMVHAIVAMKNVGHDSWFAKELDELQDRVCDREFELQYKLIELLPKSVKEI